MPPDRSRHARIFRQLPYAHADQRRRPQRSTSSASTHSREPAPADVSRLPFSLKILVENLLRCEDGLTVSEDDIGRWRPGTPRVPPRQEIAFRPARVLMQDFTGVPCVVDLAAMRAAIRELGGDPRGSTRCSRRIS